MDTSQVINMACMFEDATAMTHPMPSLYNTWLYNTKER